MAGKKKLQKRVKAIGAQVEASIRQDGEDHKFQAAESAQLFQIDSKGGADLPLTKKQKLLVKDPMVKSRKFKSDKASKFEQDKLKKIKALQEHQKQQQPVELKRAPVTTTAPLKVWGNDGEVAAPAELAKIDEYVVPAVVKKVKRRKLIASTEHKIAKVQVAAPGQSYHPEFAAHQDVMAEAVSKELERREAIIEMGKPVRAGMSEETLQYIDQRGSDEESDSDEDDSDNDGTPGKRKKMPGVITRSVRNKRSRHKQMELEHLQRRQEKAIIKQINAANHILQDIIRDEKSSEQKQELKKVLEEQKLEQEPDLVRVGGKLTKIVRETPVAFSEELTGNMRTLKPKGSLLLERYDSMHKRNMIQVNGPKSTRKRKVRIIEAKK